MPSALTSLQPIGGRRDSGGVPFETCFPLDELEGGL